MFYNGRRGNILQITCFRVRKLYGSPPIRRRIYRFYFNNKTHENASRKERFLKSVKKNFRRRAGRLFRQKKTDDKKQVPPDRRREGGKIRMKKETTAEAEKNVGEASRKGAAETPGKEKYLSKTLEGTCRAFDGTAGHYFVDYFFIHTHLRHRRRIQGYVL